MTRTDHRCLLQRLAFNEPHHFSWDNFPTNTMACDTLSHNWSYQGLKGVGLPMLLIQDRELTPDVFLWPSEMDLSDVSPFVQSSLDNRSRNTIYPLSPSLKWCSMSSSGLITSLALDFCRCKHHCINHSTKVGATALSLAWQKISSLRSFIMAVPPSRWRALLHDRHCLPAVSCPCWPWSLLACYSIFF